MTSKTRHILGISGGKDSAALAIYLKDKVPDMEYFFCDTQKELPETYDFLVKLEGFLQKPIARLNPKQGFDHWLKVFNGYLPSSRMRWCTRQLKLKPLEAWAGEDDVVSYVAIRADEDREGYVSTKPNIRPVFPFKENGVVKEDVFRILEESGVGLPDYYKWRTRSGCYFCFFQRTIEWVGLREFHPDLFEIAKQYEKEGPVGEQGYYWNSDFKLRDLEDPKRVLEIRKHHEAAMEREKSSRRATRLIEVLENAIEEEGNGKGCLVCTL